MITQDDIEIHDFDSYPYGNSLFIREDKIDLYKLKEQILKALQLKQRVEDMLKNSHESDYELKLILQELLKG